MFAKMLTLGAIATAALTVAPTAASAQYYRPGYYESVPGGHRDRGYDRGYRGYDRPGYGSRNYGGQGYYGAPRGYYDRRSDRGRRYGYGYGRGYRCDRGTGGTIIGAIAGGLLGNAIGQGGGGYYGRGDGTTGAIIGGGLGALTGRAIDRSC